MVNGLHFLARLSISEIMFIRMLFVTLREFSHITMTGRLWFTFDGNG